MKKYSASLPVFFILVLVGILSTTSWVSPGTIVSLQVQEPTATIVPPAVQPTENSWIIVDLPADATQVEYGAEVYRLVCKACHGDRGQGLTDDWRAKWPPGDQNCWQSKCHALNHPPDGFYMPQVPAVIGQPIRNFGTALDLYNYTHRFMPWHDPASMTEKESWSVTAYLLLINGINAGSDLNAETAAKIDLQENSPLLINTSTPTETVPPTSVTHETSSTVQKPVTASSPWIWLIILVLGGLLFLFLRLLRK